MKRNKNHSILRGVSMLLVSVLLGLSVTSFSPAVQQADAANLEDLQDQLEAYEEKLEKDKAALAEMKQNTADAKKRKQNLESQIGTLKGQISVLLESIATVQNDVSTTTAEIAVKEQEIVEKEEDIAQQRESFKKRMVAMQELHDAGAVAMLANVKSLYQLLTFPDVLQDIADKDNEILAELREEKAELERIKTELEAKKVELESLQAELQKQKGQMEKKRSELDSALTAAGQSLEEATAAQQEVQDMVESDELNYAALQKQIESLINSATDEHSDLNFNGQFACPMKSGTFHVSSHYGYRTWNGKKKFHAGTDLGTWGKVGIPIYAAADGYVTAAEYNSGGYGNYVLLYHGKMGDGNSYSTLYAHMQSAPSVSRGQYITRGTLLGYVGMTGRTSGPHLHLELWKGSTAQNSVANKATRIDPASLIPMG